MPKLLPSSSRYALTPTQGTKAVAAAGTPVKLVSTSTLVESVEIYARKAPATANTGNVYIGFSSTGGQNYRVLAPEGSWALSSVAGKKIDLSTIYVDAATNADAVAWTAFD